jgi:hypothetical protein
MVSFSKIGKTLFLLLITGIFLCSAAPVAFGWSVTGAKGPQTIATDQEGGKAGIIVVDGTVGKETIEEFGRKGIDGQEAGGIFQRPSPGATVNPQLRDPTNIERGLNFKPRPATNIQNDTEEAGPY